MPFLAPLVPAIAAFATSEIGSLLIGTAISVGAGLLEQQLNQQSNADQPAAAIGQRITVATSEDIPLCFPLGKCANPGVRRYLNTWGATNNTPNAYLVEVIEISNLPTGGNPGIWNTEAKLTPLWTDPVTAQGYPIQEYRDANGVDHAWAKFYDGTQVAADSYLVSKFSADANIPWTSAFIGLGTSYVIMTTLYDPITFPNGQVSWLFEPGPILTYDLRKDSTNGGSGTHRWGTYSTYDISGSNNPVILAYNIIRGVYFGSTWIYGGQNLPAFRLPSASVIAAANVCDVAISLAGGGTEPQFRAGMLLTVDVEPLTIIQNLLQSCNGRLAEIGGIFEFSVGAPGSPVYSFSDTDIVITEGQSYSPHPGLQDTYNAVEATYIEPAERYISKGAPGRYNSAWEAIDGSRRLVSGLAFAAAPYPYQVQRLMLSLVQDNRQWRTHTFYLPPSAWVLTGNCIVSWTSARLGYSSKKFIVARIDGEAGMRQVVTLREIDPNDYNWTTANQLPYATGNMVIESVPSQPMTGWTAGPITLYDNNGVGRKPSIQVSYSSGLTDIKEVWIQVKLNGAADTALYGEDKVPYGSPFYNNLEGNFAPATIYQVRGKLVPFGSRPTDWSSWITVTTDDIRIRDIDLFPAVIGFTQEKQEVTDLSTQFNSYARALREDAQRNALATLDIDAGQFVDNQQIRTALGAAYDAITANYTLAVQTAAGPNSALAIRMEALEAFVPGLATASALSALQAEVDSNGTVSATAITDLQATLGYTGGVGSAVWLMKTGYAAASGWSSRIGIQVAVTSANVEHDAGLYLEATATAARIVMQAQQVVIEDSLGNIISLFDASGQIVTNLTAGRIIGPGGLSFWDLTSGAFRVST